MYQLSPTSINSHQLLTTLINFYQLSSTSINLHQLSPTSINSHQLLSTSITLTNVYQLSSTSINLHQLSSTSMNFFNFHQLVLTLIYFLISFNFHSLQLTSINCHQLPSTLINSRSLPPNRMNVHQYPSISITHPVFCILLGYKFFSRLHDQNKIHDDCCIVCSVSDNRYHNDIYSTRTIVQIFLSLKDEVDDIDKEISFERPLLYGGGGVKINCIYYTANLLKRSLYLICQIPFPR